MKVRIDKAHVDLNGQIVVSYTFVDSGELPVAASGNCLVFANKAAAIAVLTGMRQTSLLDALKLAIKEWRKTDTNLNNLAMAVGKIGDTDTATENF